MASAAIALVLANSPAAEAHRHFLHLHHRPSLPGLGVPTVHQWVADGLMAIFFLLVGLEVKREWFDGRLSTPDERRLPILAAAGGHGDPCSGLSRRDRFRPGPRARLADPGGDRHRLGTLFGSILSAIAGWAILRFAQPVSGPDEDRLEADEIFGNDQRLQVPQSDPLRRSASLPQSNAVNHRTAPRRSACGLRECAYVPCQRGRGV